ncbi:MAG: VOC family protein [Pseudomonadales bacterium]
MMLAVVESGDMVLTDIEPPVGGILKHRFFESIAISSPMVAQTELELAVLFGASLETVALANTCIRVQASSSDEDRCSIAALALHSDVDPELTDCRGLALTRSRSEAQSVVELNASTPGIKAVDHVVLMTNDADDCIRLFGQQLGMRLALDQTVPEWGGRMLFFREGSMTLEIIQNPKEPVATDRFWGICYRCSDIEGTCAGLLSRGVEVSSIRDGRKPGSRVATIKSHCAGLPTLLVS